MVERRFPYGPVLVFSETTGDNPSLGRAPNRMYVPWKPQPLQSHRY